MHVFFPEILRVSLELASDVNGNTSIEPGPFHQQQQQQRGPVHVGSAQLMASPMTEFIKSPRLIIERQAESVLSVHQLMAKSAARGAGVNFPLSLLASAVTLLSFLPTPFFFCHIIETKKSTVSSTWYKFSRVFRTLRTVLSLRWTYGGNSSHEASSCTDFRDFQNLVKRKFGKFVQLQVSFCVKKSEEVVICCWHLSWLNPKEQFYDNIVPHIYCPLCHFSTLILKTTKPDCLAYPKDPKKLQIKWKKGNEAENADWILPPTSSSSAMFMCCTASCQYEGCPERWVLLGSHRRVS